MCGMATPFSMTMRARWSDMDFNQHMRNAAYLGCAEQVRMEFLDANGWPMKEFVERQIGPVVVEDRLRYRRELPLLAEFAVDMCTAAATSDFHRMRLQNRFRLADGTECAVVHSVVLWFDLAARMPVVPPVELQRVWAQLPRTEDFEAW